MKKQKEFIAVLLALVIFFTITYGASWLLMPNRIAFGAQWDEYLREEPNSIDVLCLGSSTVYCDVIPAIIWEETGLSTYVMGGPSQPMPVTYYYLREACKTQSPQAVVLELSGMTYLPEVYQDQNKPNLSYMPLSLNRLGAILAAAKPEEYLGLLFPLYIYHDRVYELGAGHFVSRLTLPAGDYAGYTVLTDAHAHPQSGQWERQFDTDSDAYRESLTYLKKIADFCERNHIQLVLYLAPVACKTPAGSVAALERDIEQIPHALYFNCNEGDWPETDLATDWYDSLHFNLHGAVPFSHRFAKELDALGLDVTHGDSELWRQRLARINALYSG